MNKSMKIEILKDGDIVLTKNVEDIDKYERFVFKEEDRKQALEVIEGYMTTCILNLPDGYEVDPRYFDRHKVNSVAEDFLKDLGIK